MRLRNPFRSQLVRMDLTEEEVASIAAAPAGGDAAEQGNSGFDVVLTGAGGNKIEVIKVVRTLTSCSLKEARNLVESAPKAILEGVSEEDAEAARTALNGAGATVELK